VFGIKEYEFHPSPEDATPKTETLKSHPLLINILLYSMFFSFPSFLHPDRFHGIQTGNPVDQ
jgi:hypothetical protein